MGSAIGEIAPLGIGIAISPAPIVAVILMLLSSKAKSNAPAVLAGGIAALAVVGVVVLLISTRTAVPTFDEQSTLASSARAVIGALLLLVAWRQWQSRPKDGEEPEPPGWMRQMESVNPALALGLGALTLGVNPKDTPLAMLAAVSIAEAELSAAESAATLAVFIAIATSSVAAPLTVYFALGERAEGTLNGWKAWLTKNNAPVTAALFLVIGVVLIVQGIRWLTN